MKTVVVAGATGYLGQYLVSEYRRRGWRVRAIVRDAAKARASGLLAQELVEAEATRRDTLRGSLDGVDLVVSSLGITRQQDGLTYQDVDYGANVNLLDEALSAGVSRFAYIHVLGADRLRHVPLVAAKQAFVDRLNAAPIFSTVVAPSGYFSDMGDFLAMARSGRVWLFGDGEHRLNPIDGADLAVAVADAVEEERDRLDVGGPDVFTQAEIARLAFAAIGRVPKISRLPDLVRRMLIGVLPHVTPLHVHGPAQFFLSALGVDMVGECRGSRHLAEHFADLAAEIANEAAEASTG